MLNFWSEQANWTLMEDCLHPYTGKTKYTIRLKEFHFSTKNTKQNGMFAKHRTPMLIYLPWSTSQAIHKNSAFHQKFHTLWIQEDSIVYTS